MDEPAQRTAIEALGLFRSLSEQHPSVEVWTHEFDENDGLFYSSIVSRFPEGSVRILAYLRNNNGKIEHRTYDDNGDDLWIAAG